MFSYEWKHQLRHAAHILTHTQPLNKRQLCIRQS